MIKIKNIFTAIFNKQQIKVRKFIQYYLYKYIR